jgi:two-component sensor histidine kinase
MLTETPAPADDLLLKEANHRIANQLSLLASMVQLQARAVAKGPEALSRDAVKTMLDQSQSRIIAMGKLHRQLAMGIHNDINLGDHLIEGTTALFSALALSPAPGLTHQLDADCLVTGEQAQIISLIVSEIVINAIKHAHPTRIPVHIQLSCHRQTDGRMRLEIGDDGVGFPEGFNGNGGGLGLTLIRLLAERLGADLRIESDSLGLSFILLIPTIN